MGHAPSEVQGFGGKIVSEIKVIAETNVRGHIPSGNSVASGIITSSTSFQTQFFVELLNGKQREVLVPGVPSVATGHNVGIAEFRGSVVAISNDTTEKTVWWPGVISKKIKTEDFSPIGTVPYIFIMFLIGFILYGVYAGGQFLEHTIAPTTKAITCAQPFVDSIAEKEKELIADAKAAGISSQRNDAYLYPNGFSLERVITLNLYAGTEERPFYYEDRGLIQALENKPEPGKIEFAERGSNRFEYRYYDITNDLRKEYRVKCKDIIEKREKQYRSKVETRSLILSVGVPFIPISIIVLFLYNTSRRDSLELEITTLSKKVAAESIR